MQKSGCKAESETVTALQTNPCESPAVQSIHREPALNVHLGLGIHKEIIVGLHEPITPFLRSKDGGKSQEC